MNHSNRDGWPPAQGGPPPPNGPPDGGAQAPRPLGGFGSNPPPQQSAPPVNDPSTRPNSHVLPPPSGPFFSSNPQSGHNLPSISGLGHPSQNSPHQSQRPPGSTQEPSNPPQAHAPPQVPPFFSGMNQPSHTDQPSHQSAFGPDREREIQEAREREAMERHPDAMREAELRDREMRERQQRDQGNAQEHHTSSIQLHQPVAVAPTSRAIQGLNGLFGGGGSLAGSNPLAQPLGAPPGPGNAFGSAPAPQGDSASHAQPAHQSVQPGAQAAMLPFGGPPGVLNPLGTGQGQQPILNDALSYLDQVKVQFHEHPDVYNRFLDIMKDFKSGAIDTPGVIERVSTLFAGHPNLIQGFNTFLPPGYKIECGTGDDPNAIRVTTPMGTTVSTMPHPRPLSPRNTGVNGHPTGPGDRGFPEGPGRGANPTWQQQPPGAPTQQETTFSPNGRLAQQPMFGGQIPTSVQAMSPEVQAQRDQPPVTSNATLAHQQEQRGVSQLQSAVSAATAGHINRQGLISPSGRATTPSGQGINGAGAAMAPGGSGAGMEKRGPVEFNHAISYVNKIKNRFSSQPDIYKQFLEILQTYQRESKPIQDVYAQVTSLFNGAPDLLEDFKQFLPESAAQAKAAAQRQAAEDSTVFGSARNDAGYSAGQANQNHHTPRNDQQKLPPMGNFAPTPSANRVDKRKRGERQGTAASAAAMPTAVETSNMRSTSGYGQLGAVNKRQKQHAGPKQAAVPEGPTVSPTLTPALPEPLPPSASTMPAGDIVTFFDKCKKLIANKNGMTEFLKLINFFNQDLIDKNVLVMRAQNFIGGNVELMNFLKNLVGYDDKENRVIENKAKVPPNKLSLSACRGYGPSYRLLPKREREAVCSGRDELCRSVLNDEWASHPTWASEDSGFVAHRKNVHEEGLHKIEEERHDYDFNIEACQRTIQLLEPYVQQLRSLPVDSRTAFQLDRCLGGQSEAIYQRVTKKIYGRAEGQTVINQLFDTPYNVIPVLLNRLQQKLQEWKAAQREWEKVWREQTQKIFWRSLDHQSAGAKANDKRQFQTKTLQNEIQVKYEEQKRIRANQNLPTNQWQFVYQFADEEVLIDAAQLVLTYADQNYSTDYPRLVSFIKEFVSTFFGLDPSKMEAMRIGNKSGSPSEDQDEEMTGMDEPSPRAPRINGKKGTLLRGVLDKGRTGRGSVASGSRATTPEAGSTPARDDNALNAPSPPAETTDASLPGDKWLNHPEMGNIAREREVPLNQPFRRSEFQMYCNLPIYCFFRMFVILYERLVELKSCEEVVAENVARAKQPKPAYELGLMDKKPEDYFADIRPDAKFYPQMLDMFDSQVKGEIEMSNVEETLRRFYLSCGYKLYNFDKLMSALVRFGIAVFGNDGKDKSWEIYQLFKKDRLREETTHQDELNYRKAVEKNVKEGDIYRITYVPETHGDPRAYVRVFKREEPTFFQHELTQDERWSVYVSSWTSIQPTEHVPIDKIGLAFKPREPPNREAEFDAKLMSGKNDGGLELRVHAETYRIRFTPETTEFVWQPSMIESAEQREAIDAEGGDAEKRDEDAQGKLVRNNEWMKDLSKDDVDAKKQDFTSVIDVADGSKMEVDDGETV